MAKEETVTTCPFCGHKFIGEGHKTEPVLIGRTCCDVCFETKVKPVRERAG